MQVILAIYGMAKSELVHMYLLEVTFRPAWLSGNSLARHGFKSTGSYPGLARVEAGTNQKRAQTVHPPSLSNHGQSQPKSKTEGISGPQKW